MATIEYRKQDAYTLKSQSEEIFISASTGDGQGGHYSVYKNGRKLGTDGTFSAGTAQQCIGKTIKVIATIQDKLEQTNWTSITITIKEGNLGTIYSYSEELPNHLDIAQYIIKISMQ